MARDTTVKKNANGTTREKTNVSLGLSSEYLDRCLEIGSDTK